MLTLFLWSINYSWCAINKSHDLLTVDRGYEEMTTAKFST